MNEVFRQEKKFLITTEQYYTMSRQLENILELDKHSKGEGYSIRSLYFDTLDDRDFQEKVDGIELRRKLRLRNYGPDNDFAMLEMKQKQGALQKKRSLYLNRKDASELCKGRYSVLLKYNNDFAAECYSMLNMYCYRPKAVVEYKRKAFIAKENKIRITFDHHIIGTESNFDIFDVNLIQYPVLDPYLMVLEVKYNGFLLSYIKDLLKPCNSSELSVGKYILGRSVSMHYRF